MGFIKSFLKRAWPLALAGLVAIAIDAKTGGMVKGWIAKIPLIGPWVVA